MNAQQKINTDDVYAALYFENKQNVKLQSELSVLKKEHIKLQTKCGNLTKFLENANKKIKEFHQSALVTPCVDKKILTEELTRNVKKRYDAAELLEVLLKLQDHDRFFHVVKTQSLDSITVLLITMKTDDCFNEILNRINTRYQSLIAHIVK